MPSFVLARQERFPILLLALGVTSGVIAMSGLSVTWQVLLAGAALAIGPLAAVLYVRKDLPFLLTCLYTFLLPVEINKAIVLRTLEGGWPLVQYVSLTDLIGLFLVASWGFEALVLRRQKRIHLTCLFVPLLLFLAWNLLSAVNAVFPEITVNKMLEMLKWLAVYVALVNVLDSPKRIKTVLWVLTASVLFQGFYAVLQAALHAELSIQGQKPAEMGRYLYLGTSFKQILRSSGTTQHPNVLASFFVLTVPLFLGVLAVQKGFLKKVFLWMALGAGLIGLVLSYSRAGWLSFALAVLCMMVAAWMGGLLRPAVLTGFFVSTLLGAAVLAPLWPTVFTRLVKPDDLAVLARVEMTRQAMELVTVHPFLGGGLGNYYWSSRKYPTQTQSTMAWHLRRNEMKGTVVHNRYLGTAAETGLVSLGLFLWILGRLWIQAVRNLRLSDPFLTHLSLGLLGSLAGTALFMTADHYMDNIRNIIFWLIAALVMAIQALGTGRSVEWHSSG